jgi:GH15 family glucan-1,4-alpha-glucosidase
MTTPIADYGLLSDCHTAALVSSGGAVDWFCAPRFDSDSVFGRLLDEERGGHWTIAPTTAAETRRDYLDGTLVLETTFATREGEVRLLDCLLMPPPPRRDHRRRLLRTVEGIRGSVELEMRFAPRFHYGEVDSWLRRHESGAHSATGGGCSLLLWSPATIERAQDAPELYAAFTVRQGDRIPFLMTSLPPEELEAGHWEAPGVEGVERALDETLDWWRRWLERLSVAGSGAAGLTRSALVLKALAYEPTGAMVAAPTTSLPETPGGRRNWDYRYSWIRDSVLASRSLASVGCEDEADAFRRFVERAAVGNAADLQIAYGVGGEHVRAERELEHLSGYGGARPVRVGNDGASQMQLDACAELVVQSWDWHERGHPPDDDYWRFLTTLVDSVVERWTMPDAGIWEWRGERRHFVHSKVMCWAALDRALHLADESSREVPEADWRSAREEIREAVEHEGYDEDRGVFVQAFGSTDLDAALLRLPVLGFVDYRDERMVRTTDAIADDLACGEGGLLRRYAADDSLDGNEGAFLACSFWLAEVLAGQGRHERARAVFDEAVAAASPLGLFSEELDSETGEPIGNFPQALTHLSHIEAGLALSELEEFAQR